MQTPSYDPWVNAHRSGYTQSGFAAHYDAYRPIPPAALLDLLCQFIQTPAPRLVVDLGSGTGLSTVVWAERAQRVIGIEPLEAMRRTAEARYEFPHVIVSGRVCSAHRGTGRRGRCRHLCAIAALDGAHEHLCRGVADPAAWWGLRRL